MIKETVYIKITEEYKRQVRELIENTINEVSNKYSVKLDNKTKFKIMNLAFDQINVNVSSRGRTSSMWVFDTEKNIPVIIEADIKEGNSIHNSEGAFKVKTNLTWTFNKKNMKSSNGLDYKEFENKVLEMLLEDFETASFYGTMSYITESDSFGEQ